MSVDPQRISPEDLRTLITEIRNGGEVGGSRPEPDLRGTPWDPELAEPEMSSNDIRMQIAREQLAVDDKLRSKEPVFVITASGTRRVHLPECFHVRHVLDRKQAWAHVLSGDGALTLNHLSLVYAQPHILSRKEVEQLSSYSACQACSPTLDHQQKQWRFNPKPMLAVNLSQKHMGRNVSTPEGEALGQLISPQRIVTVEGIRSITTTTAGSFERDGTEKYVVSPVEL
ncbi:hypothetical protein AB4Y88_00025 [Paenarthrobacter sp. RAF9]